MLELYQNIRNRRKELGMSQDELAKKVGYTSRSTIARVENGEIDISRSKIIAFAEALKTTPMDLLGWSDDGDIETDDLNRQISFKNREQYDAIVRLSSDSELMALVEKAGSDIDFKERLIKISKLLEK